MGRILSLLALLLCTLTLALPDRAMADPADINAAARGVVRVLILSQDGDEIIPLSHGSGFAVSPTAIVTNAHVVREAATDKNLRIGIVPANGGEAVYGQIIATDVPAAIRNALAVRA